MILNIDSTALVQHTARLQAINRSALPVAVRQTLDSTAFDVKTKTMLNESGVFVKRKPTFFKANSKVEKAQGFNINSMRAIIGFAPINKDKSHSVQDLQQQETGGIIDHRAIIVVEGGRVSKSWGKITKEKYRQDKLQFIDSKKMPGSTPGVRFLQSVVKAGVGGLVMGDRVYKNGNKMLWEVQKLGKGFGDKPKLKPIAIVKRGRKSKVKATHFMKKASDTSAGKMEKTFIRIANKKISQIK